MPQVATTRQEELKELEKRHEVFLSELRKSVGSKFVRITVNGTDLSIEFDNGSALRIQAMIGDPCNLIINDISIRDYIPV